MPKFGELLATDVWAAAARTLTDISAEEIFDLPVADDHYMAIQPLSSATADTFGSSVQISADVGAGKRLLHMTIIQNGNVWLDKIQVEFRDAADGAGNLVGLAHFGNMVNQSAYTLPLFLALADNSALHARVKDNETSANTFDIGVQIV